MAAPHRAQPLTLLGNRAVHASPGLDPQLFELANLPLALRLPFVPAYRAERRGLAMAAPHIWPSAAVTVSASDLRCQRRPNSVDIAQISLGRGLAGSTRAGLPATVAPFSTSPMTTAPMPTSAPAPIRTFCLTITAAPT